MAYLLQIRELYLRLSLRQRLAIGGAAAAILLLLAGLVHWQTERNFRPLFTKLSAEEAGPVLERLKESGAEIRLADGGTTIKVPAERVDELRIQLASAGLPKSGRMGFELFDRANFGASEFAEQVNYHRAMEGELERSIVTIREVETARVHITQPRQRLFLENRQPAKASVLVRLRPGAELARGNVQAIEHLVASAVEGLLPENVSVLDMRGTLLSRARTDPESGDGSNAALLAYREKMERGLSDKIRATLEPLLGADGFRAVVSLDCDLASGDQSEERFDPASSVMTVSQRSEEGTGQPVAGGIPGTPSNLPRPNGRPLSGSAGTAYRKSESTSYQTSRVVRRIQFPHGQVKRLSASVLLDHVVRTEGRRRVVEPPAPERVRAIRDLVAATIGFQQERGDQLIVEALPFEATRLESAPALPAKPATRPRLVLPEFFPGWLRMPLEGHLNWLLDQPWMPAALLGLVSAALALLAAGLRRITRRLRRKSLPSASQAGGGIKVSQGPELEAGPEAALLEVGDGEGLGGPRSLEEQIRERDQLQEQLTRAAIEQLEIPKAEVRRSEVLSRHVAETAVKNPEAVANLMRSWMESGGN